jgi:hypothetical protein
VYETKTNSGGDRIVRDLISIAFAVTTLILIMNLLIAFMTDAYAKVRVCEGG